MQYFLGMFAIFLCFALMGYVLARKVSVQKASNYVVEHLPHYRGMYAALLVILSGLPVLLCSIVFVKEAPMWFVAFQHKEFLETISISQAQLLLTWIYSTAIEGNALDTLPFIPVAIIEALVADMHFYWHLWRIAGFLLLCVVCASAVLLGVRGVRAGVLARSGFELWVKRVFLLGSLVAVGTSFAIAFSLMFEAWRFFYYVDVLDFFLGLNWEPQVTFNNASQGNDAFGLLPVLWGTLWISLIAMLIATPLGLMSAIYLNAYGSHRLRSVIKPALELLAGVPTIVYGFIAVLLVAPAFYRWGEFMGFVSEPTNALAAGSVMGMMLVPFISSFADDALNEVPLSTRYGSYAMGATDAETILQVMIPAAFPGIASGILLATSRAVGETMIVVMAAGLIARFAFSPFEGVTTMTVQIVAMLVGDTSFDSPKTLSAFALGITLFLLTLGLNILAFWITSRFRKYVI